jgi:hypothetical protein
MPWSSSHPKIAGANAEAITLAPATAAQQELGC